MARKKPEGTQKRLQFGGFERPSANYFRMPNSWTDITAQIDTLAELKVVEYILRHTWGYAEFGIAKHITMDEFVSGRKRRDGSRMDLGTGLSERSVRNGLDEAVSHGLVEEIIDDSDLGRIKKSYLLRMRSDEVDDGFVPAMDPQVSEPPVRAEVQSLHPRGQSLPGVQTLHLKVQDLQPRGAISIPRTEDDTLKDQTLKRSDSNHRIAKKNQRNSEGSPEGLTPPQTGSPRPSAAIPQRTSSQVPSSPEYSIIMDYIKDFARELNDAAPLKTSTTRAYNLWTKSQLNIEAFIQAMQEARQITQAATPQIRATNQNSGMPTQNKMVYFFAVLTQGLGVSELPTEEADADSAIVA